MEFEYSVTLPTGGPYSVAETLWLMSLGNGNPCQRIDSRTQACLAMRSPAGPAHMLVVHEGLENSEAQVRVHVGGLGAQWLRPHLPDILGLSFTPPKISGLRKLRQIAYDLRGLRLTRLPALHTALLKIILQQLISYRDATYGWRKLVHKYGEPVDGGDGLRYPPAAESLVRLHSQHFVECGILPQHGRRIVEVSRAEARIEQTWNAGSTADATARTCELLGELPGIGPWTLGYLRGGCLGDADAELLGDYGMPKHVAYFFEGAEEADDEDLLRLLEPYRPHRFYVLTLINRGGKHPPRRGPRRKSLRERF